MSVVIVPVSTPAIARTLDLRPAGLHTLAGERSGRRRCAVPGRSEVEAVEQVADAVADAAEHVADALADRPDALAEAVEAAPKSIPMNIQSIGPKAPK